MECRKASRESPCSSMESCSSQPPPPAAATLSTASSGYRPAISTDLHLGFSLQSCSSSSVRNADNTAPSTPRSAVTTAATACRRGGRGHGQRSQFVKVYMEGVPIGRKLDLLLLDGYGGLRRCEGVHGLHHLS